MSYTEIFGFDKEGNAYGQADIRNAHRGAMAIWSILEKRYLPPYRPSYVPSHVLDKDIESYCHYKPSRSFCMEVEPMRAIWDLVNDKRLKDCEKIALACTFDHVIIKKEDLPKLIDAFKEFEGETSLREQANVLAEMFKDENCIAVGFNQTSVNGDTWVNAGPYDEENEESNPYNLFKQTEHWFLFKDEIEDTPDA